LVPLLRLLYRAPDGSSHHLNYMALIVILILSEDACFSKSIHEIVRSSPVLFAVLKFRDNFALFVATEVL